MEGCKVYMFDKIEALNTIKKVINEEQEIIRKIENDYFSGYIIINDKYDDWRYPVTKALSLEFKTIISRIERGDEPWYVFSPNDTREPFISVSFDELKKIFISGDTYTCIVAIFGLINYTRILPFDWIPILILSFFAERLWYEAFELVLFLDKIGFRPGKEDLTMEIWKTELQKFVVSLIKISLDLESVRFTEGSVKKVTGSNLYSIKNIDEIKMGGYFRNNEEYKDIVQSIDVFITVLTNEGIISDYLKMFNVSSL